MIEVQTTGTRWNHDVLVVWNWDRVSKEWSSKQHPFALACKLVEWSSKPIVMNLIPPSKNIWSRLLGIIWDGRLGNLLDHVSGIPMKQIWIISFATSPSTTLDNASCCCSFFCCRHQKLSKRKWVYPVEKLWNMRRIDHGRQITTFTLSFLSNLLLTTNQSTTQWPWWKGLAFNSKSPQATNLIHSLSLWIVEKSNRWRSQSSNGMDFNKRDEKISLIRFNIVRYISIPTSNATARQISARQM